MDTLTHGVIAALTFRSCTKIDVKKSYLLITVVAAAFPDIDYLLFWINPYKFITEWHRGLTHSLLLLPIWAAIISSIFYRMTDKQLRFRPLFICCCLGLLSHIAADLITLYGVQLFAPLSRHRYAFFMVFDLDPWIALLAALGLILGHYQQRFARYGLLAIFIYLLAVFSFQQDAKKILQTRIGSSPNLPEQNYAIPQPFLPFHWKLIIDRQNHYEIAHLTLFKAASTFINNQLRILQAYGVYWNSGIPQNTKKIDCCKTDITDFISANKLEWKIIPKFGNTDQEIRLSNQVWQHDSFAEFRYFAFIPVLYRIDQGMNSECVWFTDMRYILPQMKPLFRYGMCRSDRDNQWKVYRLRRLLENSRQLVDQAP